MSSSPIKQKPVESWLRAIFKTLTKILGFNEERFEENHFFHSRTPSNRKVRPGMYQFVFEKSDN